MTIQTAIGLIGWQIKIRLVRQLTHRRNNIGLELLLALRFDWRDWLAAAGGLHLNPEAGLTFDSIHFALQAASRGLGVAIGTRPLVQDDLDIGTLIIPFPGIESQHEKYYVIFPDTVGTRFEVNAFSERLLGEWAR